jgi:hypothetical protein
MPGVDPWPLSRDARLYAGSDPVVAHPPCNLWVNLSAVNWKRYSRQKPAWYLGGDDRGCFTSALANVRRVGGVLEHPAQTHAWLYHGLRIKGLNRDTGKFTQGHVGWSGPYGEHGGGRAYSCEVWQSAYGHKARKRTWLYYVGNHPPFELRWDRVPGECQIGWFDRSKPTLSKKEASLTPLPFAEELVRLARWSVG